MKRPLLDLVDEAKAAGANGIRFISFPIPDRGVPASAPAAVSLIAAISDALEGGDDVGGRLPSKRGPLGSAGMDTERAIEVVSSTRRRIVPRCHSQDDRPGGLSYSR
jgi:hypothetical protein